MGIKGLFPQLPKNAVAHVTVKELEDMRIGIDGHCLLHRCCMFAAKEILIDNNLASTVNYLNSALSTLLKYADKSSFLVFDGGCLPSKDNTMEKRAQEREENLKLAKQEIANGGSGFEYLMKAFTVTHEQLNTIIEGIEAKFPKLTIILSPAEADAELAFLAECNIVDAIFSIDSDLLLYSIKYQISKFDVKTGDIDLIDTSELWVDQLEERNYLQLRKIAILAGCDYVDNLRGFGWVKLWKYAQAYNFNAILIAWNAMEKEKRVSLPDGIGSFGQYIKAVIEALLTFRYHVVFNVYSGKCEKYHDFTEMDKKLVDLFDIRFYGSEMNQQDSISHITGKTGNENTAVENNILKMVESYKERPVVLNEESVCELLEITEVNGSTIIGNDFVVDLNDAGKNDEK